MSSFEIASLVMQPIGGCKERMRMRGCIIQREHLYTVQYTQHNIFAPKCLPRLSTDITCSRAYHTQHFADRPVVGGEPELGQQGHLEQKDIVREGDLLKRGVPFEEERVRPGHVDHPTHELGVPMGKEPADGASPVVGEEHSLQGRRGGERERVVLVCIMSTYDPI